MPPRRMDDVDDETIAALNRGERETRELVESFTIDFAALMSAAVPGVPAPGIDRLGAASGEPYTRRMRLAGSVLRDELDDGALAGLLGHPSDTVRGWACFAVGEDEDRSLADRLAWLRRPADDPHFGVREWAWLGVRNAIVATPEDAVGILTPWSLDASENVRRFASEATRPRGVWSAHILLLKDEPERALPLLDPLSDDPSRYVQNSVANWLNDAAKTRPDWVRDVCRRWRGASASAATAYICRRATRSL